MLCFVLINSFLLTLLSVWILQTNTYVKSVKRRIELVVGVNTIFGAEFVGGGGVSEIDGDSREDVSEWWRQ